MKERHQQNLQKDLDKLLKSQLRGLVNANGLDRVLDTISKVCLENATRDAFERDEQYWEAMYKKLKLISLTMPKKG